MLAILKNRIYRIIINVWKVLPFKRGMALFLRHFSIVRNKLYKDLRFKGEFRIRVGDSNFKIYHHYYTSLENEIFWQGLETGWEAKTISLWAKVAKNSMCIFDVGANTGIFSLCAKAVNPKAQVYAFEPSRSTFKKLQKNVLINNFDIATNELAISKEKGIATFYDYDLPHQYSASLNRSMQNDRKDFPSKEYDVDITTLDDFIDEHKINRIDLIKIDVEKHETEVLEGFKRHLEVYSPVVFIEVLDDKIGEQVQRIFEPYDYLFFNISLDTEPVQTKDIKHLKSDNYLLCQKETAKELGLLLN